MNAFRRVLFVLGILAVSLPLFASAQSADCPVAGTELITSATRVIATYAGIPADQKCWNPKDPHVGEAAGDAKQYLASLKSGKNTCIADPKLEFSQVNDALAICAARFLKAFQDSYGTKPQITRAWNSLQCEAKLCENNAGCGGFKNSPAPYSNHVKGYAIDVTAGAKQEAMIAFANKNPKFGVCFPLASWDKVHLVLAGIKSGEKCPLATAPCDGVTFDPNIVPDPGPPGQVNPNNSTGIPSVGNLMQGLQNFFAPPPTPQCQAGYILLNGQCMPQQAQATNQVTSPFSYVTPATTPTPTAGGTTGTSVTGNNIGSGINISGLIDTSITKQSGSSTSAIDLINALANPTTTPAGSAGQPVSLNGSLGSQVVLQGVQTSNTRTLSATSTYAFSHPSDTFVSPDLSQTPVQIGYRGGSTFTLLENIKQMLASILTLLRPFGGALPNMQNSQTSYL